MPAGTPAGVRRLLLRCLERDPKRRRRDIGDALVELDDSSATTSPELRQVQPGKQWPKPLAVSVGIAVGLLGGVIATLVIRPAPSDTQELRLEIATPDFSGVNAIAISPDGNHIAWRAAGPGGGNLLWVRSLDQGEARPIAGTEGANHPAWSPDSRSIAYLGTPGTELMLVDAAGGTPLRVAARAAGRPAWVGP
jgi:hypothetical protein